MVVAQDALVPDVRKIAVLRANGIGDMMFCLPALQALRSAYPAADIALLGARWHLDFFAGRPAAFDRVIVTPPAHGVNELDGPPAAPEVLGAFFTGMQAEGFDLALQMHGGGRHSNGFLKRLGARVTVGCCSPDAPPLDRSIPYVYFQNEILRFLEVAGLVGALPTGLQPRVVVTDRDRAEADALVPFSPSLVVLNPGASDPRRRWPAHHFAQLAAALAGQGHQLAVTGAAFDRPLAATILAAAGSAGLDLTGRVSLGGTAAVFERARVVISNDTGPLHLAAAVGAPTVGIFWSCNAINGGLPLRARHRPLISFRLHCPTCGQDCIEAQCEHEDSLVGDIPLANVLAAAQELMAATRPAGMHTTAAPAESPA